MGLIWFAAVALFSLLLLWWAFPTLARVLGFLLFFDSLVTIVFAPGRALPDKLPWLALGLLIWLAGHWAWAFKHGEWASIVALRIFELPGLRWMIPRSTLIYNELDPHR